MDNSWGGQSGGGQSGGGQSVREKRGVDNQEVEKTTMNRKATSPIIDNMINQ